jgi:hypothetical protein
VNYRLHGVTVASDMALPGVRRSMAPGRAAIEISRDRTPAQADGTVEFFHSWRIKGSRGRPWLSIGRRAGGYLLRFPGLADFDVSAAGDRIVCRPSRRLAGSTLQHLLLDQVLSLASLVGSAGSMGGQAGLGWVASSRSLGAGYVAGGIVSALALPWIFGMRRLGGPPDRVKGTSARFAACESLAIPAVEGVRVD